jgi:hypothetical protein
VLFLDLLENLLGKRLVVAVSSLRLYEPDLPITVLAIKKAKQEKEIADESTGAVPQNDFAALETTAAAASAAAAAGRMAA